MENCYRFVWEFTPSQGNGTIAAIALISKQGGVVGYGSLENSQVAFYQMMETKLEMDTAEELEELSSAVLGFFGHHQKKEATSVYDWIE